MYSTHTHTHTEYLYLRQRKRQKLGKLVMAVILSARTGKTLPSQNTIVPNKEQPTHAYEQKDFRKMNEKKKCLLNCNFDVVVYMLHYIIYTFHFHIMMHMQMHTTSFSHTHTNTFI